ncbi:ABA4-like family protein [Planomonospora alba]|uniref:ABA4-like family protein n=1 Tax=Planomonospora alba TaxID=161354 RepID=A0ABP6NP47_9ACTN
MTELLFQLSFLAAAPFWALMIAAPTWARTRRIAGSPLIVLPSLAVCLVLLAPVLGEVWPVVTRPTLAGLTALVADPRALAALWAQVISWDLLVGRWIYLDGRHRRVHPLLMAPILVLTIFLSPLALPIYLAVRGWTTAPLPAHHD